jgi:hypothetical protein
VVGSTRSQNASRFACPAGRTDPADAGQRSHCRREIRYTLDATGTGALGVLTMTRRRFVFLAGQSFPPCGHRAAAAGSANGRPAAGGSTRSSARHRLLSLMGRSIGQSAVNEVWLQYDRT